MSSLRIGDVERDQAAEALSAHFAAGRLDHSEFDTRLAAAYAARTGDDLAALFADLPGAGLQLPPAASAPARQRQSGTFPVFPVLVLVVLLGATIAAVTHGFPPVFLFVALWMWRGGRHHHRAGRSRG